MSYQHRRELLEAGDSVIFQMLMADSVEFAHGLAPVLDPTLAPPSTIVSQIWLAAKSGDTGGFQQGMRSAVEAMGAHAIEAEGSEDDDDRSQMLYMLAGACVVAADDELEVGERARQVSAQIIDLHQQVDSLLDRSDTTGVSRTPVSEGGYQLTPWEMNELARQCLVLERLATAPQPSIDEMRAYTKLGVDRISAVLMSLQDNGDI